jgi:hypothetical protein
MQKQPKPFTLKRIVSSGADVTKIARVSRIEIKPVDVDQLFLEEPTTFMSSMIGKCKIPGHARCRGHLPGKCVDQEMFYVGYPSFMTLETETTVSPKSKFNKSLFSGILDCESASKTAVSFLLGKRGDYRAGLMSIKPVTSARGVATACWEGEPWEVWINDTWASRMKVAYRQHSDAGLSSTVSFRPVYDGDYAVLHRCPVIYVSSMQAVRVRLWTNPTIGCHPFMCKAMNLDFDGDEVHVTVPSSLESQAELSTAIQSESYSDFSAETIASHLNSFFSPSTARSEAVFKLKTESITHSTDFDFMMSSTCSITQVENRSFTASYHRLCRMKEESRKQNQLMLSESRNLSKYVGESLARISDVVDSHLTVSKGYTLARQLKLVAGEVCTMHLTETPSWSDGPCTSALPKLVHPVSGIPGLKFVILLTEKLIQSHLDKAKHGGGKVEETFLQKIMVGSARHTVIRNTTSGAVEETYY